MDQYQFEQLMEALEEMQETLEEIRDVNQQDRDFKLTNEGITS